MKYFWMTTTFIVFLLFIGSLWYTFYELDKEYNKPPTCDICYCRDGEQAHLSFGYGDVTQLGTVPNWIGVIVTGVIAIFLMFMSYRERAKNG